VVVSLPVTPDPAVGVPLVSSGGQAAAHAPEHVEVVPVSAANRYSARPWALVRYLPIEPVLTFTVTCPVPVGLGLGVGVGVLAAAGVATAATTPSAATASATEAGRARRIIEIISQSSPSD
jgi:hypothetical protein